MLERPNQPADFSIARWLPAFVRYAWLIAIGTVVGGGTAWLLATEDPVVYSSTSKLMVQESQGSAGLSSSDIALSRNLASTYSALITTRPVLEEAAARLGIDGNSIASRIDVSAVGGTRILAITARFSDSQRAADIANEVASVFIERTRDTRLAEIAAFQEAALAQGVTDVGSVLSSQLGGLNSIQVVEAAVPGVRIQAAGNRGDIILGAGAGFTIAVGLVILFETLFDVVRSRERYEAFFSAPVLALLPRGSVGPEINVENNSGDEGFTEGVRFLRTNLQFVPANRGLATVLVTSAEANSGKSTIVAHLSRSIAEAGKSVVVVDADLRKPTISSALLDPLPDIGVSTYLSDVSQNFDDVLFRTALSGLQVVPSGPRPPNPSELLNTPRFNELLKELSKCTDLVIIDSPPTLAVSDTPIMAGQVDGVVLVVDTTHTRTHMLRAVLQSLERVDANIVGAVLNKYRGSRFSYGYGYGSYYSYGYGESSNGTGPKGIRNRLKRIGRAVLPGSRG